MEKNSQVRYYTFKKKVQQYPYLVLLSTEYFKMVTYFWFQEE